MVFDPLKRKQAIEAAVARYREVNKLPLPEWEEELVYLNTIIEGD